MNKIKICSCGREKAYLTDGIRTDIYCSKCGEKIEYVDPPIIGVYVETEGSSNSHAWVPLKGLKEALDALQGEENACKVA